MLRYLAMCDWLLGLVLWVVGFSVCLCLGICLMCASLCLYVVCVFVVAMAIVHIIRRALIDLNIMIIP